MGVHTGVSLAYYRSLPSGYTRPGVLSTTGVKCDVVLSARLEHIALVARRHFLVRLAAAHCASYAAIVASSLS